MANAREIQSRIKSIEDTRKITNAMYMISSTKLRRAKKELEDTEPFFFALQNLIARMLRHLPEAKSRYLTDCVPDGNARKTWLVVTGDKGLAGAYNHNVLKLAQEQIEKGGESHLLVVGEVGRQYFHTQKIPVDEHFLYTAQNPTMHRARVITARLLELYESGQTDEVYVVYTSMKNGLQNETNLVRLLPLVKENFLQKGLTVPAGLYQEEFHYEPSPEEVLDKIIPNYLTDYLYGALVESYCSEHQARMTAMQAANDSAQQMLHELGIEYNRVRQAAITQEITEVVAGAKAQKQKKERQKKK